MSRKVKPLSFSQKKDVRKIAKRVVSSVQEFKNYYQYDTGTNVSTTGAIIDLCAVSQGDGDTNRDGDVLYKKSMELQYTIAAADATNICRVIIFQYKPDSTPTAANILLDATNVPWLSAYNLDHKQMFQVMYDKVHHLVLGADSELQSGRIRLYGKKLGTKKIQYDSAGTGGSNKLWMLRISDSGAVNHPAMAYYETFRFTDS